MSVGLEGRGTENDFLVEVLKDAIEPAYDSADLRVLIHLECVLGGKVHIFLLHSYKI